MCPAMRSEGNQRVCTWYVQELMSIMNHCHLGRDLGGTARNIMEIPVTGSDPKGEHVIVNWNKPGSLVILFWPAYILSITCSCGSSLSFFPFNATVKIFK